MTEISERDETQANETKKVWGMSVPTYCMLMHLSTFAHLLPGAGFVLLIVMWVVNKEADPRIDTHGKIILNWFITSLLYATIFFLLIFVLIGIPLLFLLGLVSTIFAIIGGLKAYEDKIWPYPGSLRIFKIPVTQAISGTSQLPQ